MSVRSSRQDPEMLLPWLDLKGDLASGIACISHVANESAVRLILAVRSGLYWVAPAPNKVES
eukprot:scaffold648459_cov45-Prasinocladus_malaysianus.AAC.1